MATGDTALKAVFENTDSGKSRLVAGICIELSCISQL